MTTTINASPTNGLVQTADGSGVLKVQSNGVTTNALAWVNFNGTPTSGSATIRAAYNVSSVSINGTGDYTLNFTNALSDANYAVTGTSGGNSTGLGCVSVPYSTTAPTTTALRIQTPYVNGGLEVKAFVSVAIFGN